MTVAASALAAKTAAGPRVSPVLEPPELDRMLAASEARPPAERPTLIRLFEKLRGSCREGGCDAVRRYARGWQHEQASVTASAFVPVSFDPGEVCQFHWSHEVVLTNGTTIAR